MIQMNIRTPFRIVSRIIPNVDTMERISAELNIERDVQNQFDDLGGSIMCSYDVSKIEPSKKKQWRDDLRQNHHTVIYVPKSGHSEVFTMDQQVF
ncbi:hypothetical protein [Candidatus Nitrosotalea okcheonensis]|uniref:Uncharacterized protein n=1 Tax=Candidatus Nitrosotalea okcheonensis TaxID=1903276 RepID=A0A2H1FEE2_9ARCH|nr:hypothetical protein [Candidatus Nitrosotalea okcheonensis]SMH71152.1 protein of unknown function [Candidatus Nitrosotalea okcheonensis]